MRHFPYVSELEIAVLSQYSTCHKFCDYCQLTHKQLEIHWCDMYSVNTDWYPGSKVPEHQYQQCWQNFHIQFIMNNLVKLKLNLKKKKRIPFIFRVNKSMAQCKTTVTPLLMHVGVTESCALKALIYIRDDSRLAPIQWETSLQSNAVSHWLGANLESALCIVTVLPHRH